MSRWLKKGSYLTLLLFLLILGGASSVYADYLDEWQWRNPLPQGNTLSGVVYGSNTFVAVGGYGTILTSPDGETWTIKTTGISSKLNGVTYGNNTFVAVGGYGTILTSPDGETWTSRISGTSNWLGGVTYVNNTFVAVGKGGIVLTSPDGETWTSRISGTSQDLYGVTYGNNTFVAVGDGGIILTSPDGETWTSRSSGTTWELRGVTYGNNTFAAVGYDGAILTSPDGVTWTSRTSDTSYMLWGVNYSNNTFIAVGWLGTILTSSDGETWTRRTSGTFKDLFGFTYGNNTYVAVGEGGIILASPDGETWTNRTSGTSDKFLEGVTYGNNTFVAVGKTATILTSPDGETWTDRTSVFSNILNGVTYVNNTFVAVGDTILTSPDGVTWTSRTSGSSDWLEDYWLEDVTYGNNIFVAVGWNFSEFTGIILTSPDGETWTRRTPGTSNMLLGVTYGNNTFVAVGNDGIILTSPDGENWTSRTSGTSPSLDGVTYSNNTFVAVGYENILTSPDGVNWTSRTSGNSDWLEDQWLKNITYGNNTFVAVGNTILTSPDGETWTSRTPGVSTSLKGVMYGNNTFIAVGIYGGILQSGTFAETPDTTPPNGSLSINNGAGITSSTVATLNISASDDSSGVAQMMISNGQDFAGAVWENYSSSKPWALAPGNGSKTVYIKFKDNAGNVSTVYSDSITLQGIPFQQGSGYQSGAYDAYAAQATFVNWSGLSGYNGPNVPELKMHVRSSVWLGSPVIGSSGNFYSKGYVSENGTAELFALDTNGRLLWDSWIGPYATDPVIGSDGTLYLGAITYNTENSSKLLAFNSNGTEKWEFTTADMVYAAPAIGADGTIYVGGGSTLYAVYPDGTKKWETQLGSGKITASPAIGADGTIYVGAGGRLYAVNQAGALKWSFATTGDNPVSTPIGVEYDYSGFWYFLEANSDDLTSAVIGADGTIYFGSVNGSVYAVNPDGSKQWEYQTNGRFFTPPAINSEGVIYAASENKLYAINLDGTKRWEFTTSGRNGDPLIGSDGTIYLKSDGNLIAVNLDGTKKWSFLLDGVLDNSLSIGANGEIYIGGYSLHAVGEQSAGYNPLTDATLTDLKLNGSTLSGFDPNLESYNIILTAGSAFPIITTAYADGDRADITITNATSLPGTAYVVVTAVDGVTTKSYKINFIYQTQQAPVQVQGIVLDQGIPLVQALVWFEPVAGEIRTWATTGNDGKYELHLTPGQYITGVVYGEKLFKLSPDNEVNNRSNPITLAANVYGLNFTEIPLYTISGQVTLNGTPVNSAQVTAINDSQSISTVTDTNGNYTLKLPNGSYTVEAVTPSGARVSQSFNVTGNQTEVNLMFPPLYTITGRVYSGNYGIYNAAVGAFSDTAYYTTTSGFDGRFMLQVPAGSYQISAATAEGQSIITKVYIVGETFRDLAIPSAALISGKVTSDGDGTAGAWVSANPINGLGLGGGTVTGSDGSYNIYLPAGKYWITASNNGYPAVTGEEITVAAGDSKENININLTQPQGSLTGVLNDAFGKPLVGAYIWAESNNATLVQTQTDGNGTFILRLNNGSWDVWVAADGYRAKLMKRVVIPASSNISLAFTQSDILPVKVPVTATINPTYGGKVQTENADLIIAIPPHALNGSDQVLWSVKPTTAAPAGINAIPVKVFEINAVNVINGAAVTIFRKPVEFRIRYTRDDLVAADLNDNITGQNGEDNLRFAYLSNDGSWVIMPNLPQTEDPDARGGGYFIVQTDHLTKFAIVRPRTLILRAFEIPSYSSGGGGGGGGGSSLPSAVNSTTGSAIVNPSAGGIIGLGTEAVVDIPAGALNGTSSVQVNVQKVNYLPAFSTNQKLVSGVFEFSVDGQKTYSFGKSVTLKLSFDTTLVGANETPAIFYYDELQRKWINLGGVVSGNNITVQVNHFTKYAILAVKKIQIPIEKNVVKLNDINGHWAAQSIQKLVAMGAIDGYPNGKFKPNGYITRAEFTAVLISAFKLSPRRGKVFTDTIKNWAKDAISTATSYGIVNGFADGTFAPGKYITREQAAVMIAKAINLNKKPGKITFKDSARISAWAKDAVVLMVNNGIITGNPDKTFNPKSKATRAEAVSIIINALKYK